MKTVEWFRESQNWQVWSTRVNMRFIACLSLKLVEGAEPGQAVNNLIRSFVEELIAQDVPTEIIAAFATQYTANRAEILAVAAKWTERMHANG